MIVQQTIARRLIAILLCASMILAAGCAGAEWGEDGPAEAEDIDQDDNPAANTGTDGDNGSESTNGSGSSEITTDQGVEEDDGDVPPGESTPTTPGTEALNDDEEEMDPDRTEPSIKTDTQTQEEKQERINDAVREGVKESESDEDDEADEQSETDDRTCSTFDTHDEAQTYYEDAPEQRDHLDGDGDGVVCETFPEASENGSEDDIADDQETYTYLLTVEVVDEHGNPLPNELVRIGVLHVQGDEKSFITDENGEVTMEYIADSKDEYQDFGITARGELRDEVHVRAGENHERVVVDTDDSRVTHELAVYAGEAYPIEGVDVTIERWDGATTTKTTDEEGRASFEVYPGKYTITGEYEGDTQTETITIEDDRRYFLPFERPTPETINDR